MIDEPIAPLPPASNQPGEAGPARPPIVGPFPASLPPGVLAGVLADAQRQGVAYAGMPTLGPPLGLAAQVQLWQGQFPPPEAIEHYEKVLPGSFSRMIAMAEATQAAQAEGSQRALTFAQADTRRGQFLGAATTMLAICGACGCVALGAWKGSSGAFWVAAALVGVPVMAVGKALVESARSPSGRDFLKAVQAPLTPTPPTPP